jgi:UDP-3-O-[3-hydroxymyristoyl] N-acetylglucosamine deacetylase
MQLNILANSPQKYPAGHSSMLRLDDAVLPYQFTLKGSVTFKGVGLHSGRETIMIVRPAADNTGIRFVRTDLKSNNEIEARYDYVTSTFMSTELTNDAGAKIATVEHIMAALAGLGITNAIIDIDGPEVPIMDGSSLIFCEAFKQIGLQRLQKKVQGIQILKTVKVDDGKGATASFLPDDARLMHMKFDLKGRLNDLIKNPDMVFDLDHDDFYALLSHARTFGFYEDAQKLIQAGLARGASLDNTIVIKDNAVMNDDGLRDDDEFVQHKLLDAVGDLALAGVHIVGAFKGVNSGHGLNNKLLRKLFSTPNAWCWVNTDFLK